MNNLINLEKKINSELTTKINSSEVKHEQLYLNVDSEDIIDVLLFLKTNEFICLYEPCVYLQVRTNRLSR